MVAHVCNPSTWGLLQKDHKLKDSLDYIGLLAVKGQGGLKDREIENSTQFF
jgi:hypothetical protein